ncbi:GNAT family N-acetyltransferase [Aurantimonas sp. VKM B-3413]|uniref:GNAT family N-acetyltransferase n=1 Tax=Aurantimonas sp. VKM B-3413 TaxID=2779401 RepID=UPI001E28F781|nr:GNAT family N-acetyltransferase [Aurantimonas sp. VKM B-3413]MCB8838008.1 GNAT family N-acetyltransferase [Aurantimonas sp. VKM B-3413]
MNTLRVRAATKADLPAIVAMLADDDLGRAREAVGEPLHPGYLDAFAAIEADPNQILAVAAIDGAIVGTLQLSFLPGLSYRGGWRGQIEAVRIASDRRGQGLGRRVIQWAIETCRERGCRNVQLTSSNSRLDAHRFYRQLGFEQSHTGFKLTL